MEDFGEYTPLDSRSANGMRPAPRCTTSTHPVPLRAQRSRAGAAGRSQVHPLRLDGVRAVRADRLGRRPERRLGLRRSGLGRDERADDGPVGDQHLGLGHRRLLRPLRDAAHAGAADPLDRARRRVGCDAHPGERDPHPPDSPRPQVWDPTIAPTGAAGRSCARSSTRTSRPPTPSTAHRAADHAPPGAGLPARPARDRPGGRVPVRSGPAGRAGARAWRDASAGCTCPRASGSTCGARRRRPRAGPALARPGAARPGGR